MQFVDQGAGIIGGALHGDHAGGLFTGDIFHYGLVNQGFHVALQQLVEHLPGIRFIDVIPDMCKVIVSQVTYRDKLFHSRPLRHRIDELIGHYMQLVDFPFQVGVQHHLDGADKGIQPGRIADMGRLGDDVRAQPPEIGDCLVANDAEVDLYTGIIPFFHSGKHIPVQVRVQAAAQAAVRRNDHQPNAFYFCAGNQVRVLVLRVGRAQVRYHVADFIGIGSRHAHPFLGLAHFAGGHHLHRLGDLLGVLHTRDLGADFFTYCHSFFSVPDCFVLRLFFICVNLRHLRIFSVFTRYGSF